MLKTKEKLNYIDVTDEWLNNATPFEYKVLDRDYFEHNGIKYFVDGKNVVLDYSKKEKEIALWLEATFGGEFYMLPRINYPECIKTADYLWNGEYWDLKEINKSAVSELRSVDNIIKNAKNQTSNIILDITKSKISQKSIVSQVQKIYSTPKRKWLNKIIIKKNNYVILIYIRKKEIDPSPNNNCLHGVGPISRNYILLYYM